MYLLRELHLLKLSYYQKNFNTFCQPNKTSLTITKFVFVILSKLFTVLVLNAKQVKQQKKFVKSKK
jgi:hypothetical protein